MNIRRRVYTCLLCVALPAYLQAAGSIELAAVEQSAIDQGTINQGDMDQGEMVYIPDGSYAPLFTSNAGFQRIPVKSYLLDRYAVTNRQYSLFTRQHPKWDRKNIKAVFSDSNYLKHLVSDEMGDVADSPVTNVSWFSARAYCKSLGKRLPSLDEWEYAARASDTDIDGSDDPKYRQKILEWYSRPATARLPNVRDTEANYWGVHGMHGVVWELVNDFNTALVTGESRGDSQLEQQLFCGAGAVSSADPGDYAAFMRYALRSSYRATYTMESLGFRCAKDVSENAS